MKYINFKLENNLVLTDTNFDKFEFEIDTNSIMKITINLEYDTAYGFGEKYDVVNQIGKIVDVKIKEVCFNQGSQSYMTFPFMITANGFGIYVKSKTPVQFDLTNKKFVKQLEKASKVAKYALILGEDELSQNKVTVKDLETAKQVSVERTCLVNALL